MPFVELSTGIRMHYRDCGKGRPILFVPGYSATVDTWNYQVLALADRFRCVAVDLRGHGDSDKPLSAYTYEEMCQDLKAFVEALDLRDVVFVGWSMGSGVGLKYVAEFNGDKRVAKLVMVAPATPRFLATDTEPYGMTLEEAQAALEGIRVALPEVMAAFAGRNFKRQDMEATKTWMLYGHWLRMPAYVGYRYFRTLITEDLRDLLPKVDLPVLICHSREDQVCHYGWVEYMAARLKDCRVVWFEGSGHALMLEEPDRFSQVLAEFAGG
ncbi:alpha/beta hydrolase [Thermus sp. FJN-A]